jgi:hypothetical protein
MACLVEDSLQLHTLRSLIEENLHQLEHLIRSQHEIREYLLIDPGDADFSAALSENEVAMSLKKGRILNAHDVLLENDPNYRNEPLFDKVIVMQETSQLGAPLAAVPTTAATQLTVSDEGAYL